MKTIRTDRARKTFLETLRASCNVSAAARSAGISRSAVYKWREEEEEFAAEWNDAEGEAVDNLEGVAYSRAMAGESDRMVEILLKGHRPDRYVAPQKVKHVGGDEGDSPIQTVTAVEWTVVQTGD